ncbi:hypothetical protein ACWKSP_20930 [Micromonosporaceae bacterium Da 78-11]
MKSLVTLGALAVAMTVAASPASAATRDTFELTAGVASAYGTYHRMMSIPERPVPPVQVSGTLAVNGSHRCGVVQIAYNGPADGIEWRTLSHLCGPGKTNFRASTNLLWGGAQPQLRLCKGGTVAKAERGLRCDVYTPVAG